MTIKSVNIYHAPQACGWDGSFGRQEAILPCCTFAYSDGEWAEPLKQNIFSGARFLRTSCLQMTCRYTHNPPPPHTHTHTPALDKETCWNPDKRGCSATLTRCRMEETGCEGRWKRGGGRSGRRGGQAGRHTLSPCPCDAMIRRH